MHLLIPFFLAATKAKTTKTSSSSSDVFEIVLLVFVVYIAYRMFVRPQSARAKQQQQVLRQVEIGDEILTTSGIYATVVEIDDDRITVELSPENTMTIARTAIARRITEAEEDEPEDDEDHEGHDHGDDDEDHDHEDSDSRNDGVEGEEDVPADDSHEEGQP